MNDLISVIIPVFNSENAIIRCLKSLQEQEYRNLEIIIIDDGSTDKTLKKCKFQASQDQRLKVYHIDNHGVSFARNYGISVANGKWIMFVDSDDYLLPNAFMNMINDMGMHSADIYCWNAYYSRNKHLEKMGDFIPKEHLYLKSEIKNLMYGLYCKNGKQYYGDFFRAVWGKVFSSELLKRNAIKFPEKIKIGEDALYILDCLYYATSVFMKNDFIYGYECTESSVTGRYKKNFQEYQIDEYYSMRDRFEKYDLDIDVASVEFWHKGEKDYIKNELKICKDIFEVAHKTVSWINGYPEIMRYLCMLDKNAGLRSKIRTSMLQFNLKYLVAIIDTVIIKKKCEKSGEIR